MLLTECFYFRTKNNRSFWSTVPKSEKSFSSQTVTGYYFDSETSCSCILIVEHASTILEILVLVLTSFFLLMAYGSYHVYHRNREASFDRRRSKLGESISELRALFAQNSRHPSGADANSGGSAASGQNTVAPVAGDNPSSAHRPRAGTFSAAVPMRPRASTFSFFPLRCYEEIREDETR